MSAADAPDPTEPSSLHFGAFHLDLKSGELRKNGTLLRLQPQPFKVLCVLASRPGDVVTRDELRSIIWGDQTFVDFDQGLNFCIRQIRTALHDLAQTPRFVETLPRRGYRFLMPVKAEGGTTRPGPAPGSEYSIAVLPFADMSPERDQDYFCEGIAEEILNALRRVEGLRVASRASAFRFRSRSLDAGEIGRRLGVGTLLHGSLRKAGSQLRITVELIDVSDGFRIFSERYDRELQDLFALQEAIAQSVVVALQIRLTARVGDAPRKCPTANLDAYDFYLRGRKHFFQSERRSIQFAIDLFSRAIERDPNYARAYAGIADCHAYLFVYGGRDPQDLERARAASQRALGLDPELAEAHASHGLAHSLLGEHAQAESGFETAIRLDPRLFEAHYFFARGCFMQGKLEEAVRHYEQAMAIRPEDYQCPLLIAQIYDDLGRPEAARSARQRGIRMVETRLEIDPDDVRALYMGANGLVTLGERDRGLRWADRALALNPDEPMILYNVACILCLAGEHEAAIDCLERAAARGFTQRAWLEHDCNLDPIRSSPRFEVLLQTLS